jgi:hypothetical protein
MKADHESASEVIKRVQVVIEEIAKDIERERIGKDCATKREEGER